jgi:hypothetical protein
METLKHSKVLTILSRKKIPSVHIRAFEPLAFRMQLYYPYDVLLAAIKLQDRQSSNVDAIPYKYKIFLSFCSFQTGPGANPASHPTRIRDISRGRGRGSGQNLKLTIYVNPVSRLRTRGATIQLPHNSWSETIKDRDKFTI